MRSSIADFDIHASMPRKGNLLQDLRANHETETKELQRLRLRKK